MRKVFSLIFLSIIFFLACNDSNTPTDSSISLEVSVKMEALIYNTDPIPQTYKLTKVYFYSALEDESGERPIVEISESTTCPNGWATQEFRTTIFENDRIIFGVTTIYPPEQNYKYKVITFDELKRFSNESGNVEFVKTFQIYE